VNGREDIVFAEIDYSDLPENNELAFVELESQT
jgi:hypothetical protein